MPLDSTHVIVIKSKVAEIMLSEFEICRIGFGSHVTKCDVGKSYDIIK